MENINEIQLPLPHEESREWETSANLEWHVQFLAEIVFLTGTTIAIGLVVNFILFKTAHVVLLSFFNLITFVAFITLISHVKYIAGIKKIEVLENDLSLKLIDFYNAEDFLIIPLMDVLFVGKIERHTYKMRIKMGEEEKWFNFVSRDREVKFILPWLFISELNSDVIYLKRMVQYAQKSTESEIF